MRSVAPAMLVAVAAAVFGSMLPRAASAAEVPADRVVAMYFHRTERCETCQKMGSYSEEAVKTGFAQRIKSRTLAFHYVDFQDPKNAALAKGYGITGPALVIARTANGKVIEFKNLDEIWTKVADKPEFLRYVEDQVAAYDPPADRVVAIYFHRTQRCPTCKKMGSYSEEAVGKKFAPQVSRGEVAFYYVDFQDRKNAALAKRYSVTGPALIVARLRDNKVVESTNLKDIWSKVADKPGFLTYVQQNVAAYRQANASENRPPKKVAAASSRAE